jgi:hypothetical protein
MLAGTTNPDSSIIKHQELEKRGALIRVDSGPDKRINPVFAVE